MNKLFLGFLAGSALLFTSCDKEEELSINEQTQQVTFTATIEGNTSSPAQSATRTTVVSGSGEVLWSTGDAISVVNTNNVFDDFVLSTGAGTNTAEFTGSFTNGATGGYIAIYPAGAHTYDGATLTVNLPSSYGSTDTEYTANSNVLMMANQKNNKLYFKHLGAVLRIPVVVPVGATSVSLTGKGICGDFVVDMNGENATISQPDGATDQTVTYNFKAFTAESEQTFFFPIPTGTYDQFVVKVAAQDGSVSKTLKFGAGGKAFGRKVIAKLATLTNVELHEWVDLDLPSGLLWAKTNVGAATETESGFHFAWGETTQKESYTEETYKFGSEDTKSKYNPTDGLTTLESEDDAAYVNWGSKWDMPTITEFFELFDNTTQETATLDGVEGTKFINKTDNSKYIFLPNAGPNPTMYSRMYWTSSRTNDATTNALFIQTYSSSTQRQLARYIGMTVRPVRSRIQNAGGSAEDYTVVEWAW